MEDLRRIKSREALKHAFWHMLSKKKYISLTIKDIVEEAGLNRKTFNAHYEDIEALMQDCVYELMDDLHLHFQTHEPDGSMNFAAATRAYTRFAWDNRNRFQLLFQNNLDSIALRYWKSCSFKPDPNTAKDLDSLRIDLFTNYTTYSCWGNLLWVLDHADDMPFEQLAEEALHVYQDYLEQYLQLCSK